MLVQKTDSNIKMSKFRTSLSDDVYPMTRNPRGEFIIINNENFTEHNSGWPDRPGTNNDAIRLKNTFENLYFKTTIVNNCTKKKMIDVIKQVAQEDHKTYDCLGIAILTHGGESEGGKDLLFGVDGEGVELEDMISPLKDRELATKNHLVGKPKIIFVQACRGTKIDHGNPFTYYIEFEQSMCLSKHENGKASYVPEPLDLRIPVEADFLYHYSTATGYFAWRNEVRGAVFIEYLCQVLDEDSDGKRDLFKLLARVNGLVAEQFEARSTGSGIQVAKQMPVINNLLQKRIILSSKLKQTEQTSGQSTAKEVTQSNGTEVKSTPETDGVEVTEPTTSHRRKFPECVVL